jgi:hypothetical protein
MPNPNPKVEDAKGESKQGEAKEDAMEVDFSACPSNILMPNKVIVIEGATGK